MKSILKLFNSFVLIKVIITTFFLLFFISYCHSQDKVTTLKPDTLYEQTLLKNQTHKYKIKLRKDDFCSLIVMQAGVDVAVDVSGPYSKKIASFDTTNGSYGAEYIRFTADDNGTYYLKIYPLNDYKGMTEAEKNKYTEQNQGKYEIRYVSVIPKEDYIQYSSRKQRFMEDLNLGFEKTTPGKNMPDNWYQDKTSTNITDSKEKHGGNNSVMLERDNPGDPAKFVWKTIPPAFEGNVLEVRAFMKMKNVSDGQIDLMIRLDGFDDMISIKSMQSENINGTSDWKQYSIWLPYSKDTRQINFGALLYGKGQLWVDDFQILIDGVDIDEYKYTEPKKYKAEEDTEFDNGSRISSINLNETTIENLTILGKVWGFLKYYHPAIGKGDYNWDYELFRIMPAVLAANTPEKRNEVLSDWITGLGKLDTDKMIEPVEGEIKLYPDLNWINDSGLGEKLAGQLTAIKNTKRDNDNYYIGMAFEHGNPRFRNERSYGSMNFPDAGFRLLTLYRYWNIIQYYNPNKSSIGEDWNKVLIEFIPEFVNSSDELEYKLTLLSLIARVHDSHAYVWGSDIIEQYKGNNFPPVKITFIENKAVVTDYLNNEPGEESGLKIGDVIEAVNGKPVDEIVTEKLPYTSASNYPTQLRNMSGEILRTNDSILTVEFTRGDSRMISEIKCDLHETQILNQLYSQTDTCFKFISSDIAYLYPATFKDEYLPKILDEVQNTKGLIIDMRCYPSRFNENTMLNFLYPDTVGVARFSYCSITSPGLFTLGDNYVRGTKNSNFYKGKVVILVNEISQSNAEGLASDYQMAPNAVVIGSTTAGANGTVSLINLPGGVKTYITAIGVYHTNGIGTQRIGIVPDIEVKPTIKGISEGRDELLERAIEIINGE